MRSGADLIADERARQISDEGWTPQHDDAHDGEELALAGAIYAWPDPRPVDVKLAWPWARKWWKPTIPEIDIPARKCGCRSVGECTHFGHASEQSQRTARIRDLAKAGALIAAEIDRLQRISPDTNREKGDG